MNVTVYSKNKCPMCNRTKRFLKAKGVEFTEKNTDTNETYLDEARATGFSAMPIVVIEGHDTFASHDQSKLEKIFGEL